MTFEQKFAHQLRADGFRAATIQVHPTHSEPFCVFVHRDDPVLGAVCCSASGTSVSEAYSRAVSADWATRICDFDDQQQEAAE